MDRTTDPQDRHSVQTFLNAPIKDVITRFPPVGAILSEYEVGCVDCGVGTCLLKDVVGIHDLSEADERVLMTRIAGVIFPGEAVTIPVTSRAGSSAGAGAGAPRTGAAAGVSGAAGSGAPVRYSPPVRRLVDEHVLIMRWVRLIPRLLEVVDVQAAGDRQWLLRGVDFIRSYADRFHHAKEEGILFKYFDESLDIIQVMLAEHETARAHVRSMETAIADQDQDTVAAHLTAYGALLTEHIKKEDTILYPWLDRRLSTAQVGDMFSRFAQVDAAVEPGFAERYARLVTEVEEIVKERKGRT